ncbi:MULTISPECIES: GNAT family N-acetyltransferase [Bacillaceae]|uniref:Acetyltransferase n=1 Tax=Alkalicoccobacillus plakortidis TaxID=444060 RepID=A0A9D5DQ49_9BACI|nr:MULTISPECIES: GNAT family N-acetyltransferase [Bacillaceae]KQL58260.1 acetyltransferase [Alkalicoccobacillus plakortidis]
MTIRQLHPNEVVPYDLLLLADPNKEIVDSYIKQGSFYVHEQKGQHIGCYVMIQTRPETIEIVNVAVKEALHGNGYGKALVQHAIETAKQAGYKTVEIGTSNSGIHQIALYQRCGFRLEWIDRGFFLRHYEEAIWENGIQAVDMVRMAIHF